MLASLRAGDHTNLCHLLDEGVDCDQTFRLGGWARPAICLAVEGGHYKAAEELCKRGCATFVVDAGGLTPLHLASAQGNARIAKLLMAHRACINSRSTTSGDTPLHLAAAGGHNEMAKLLLDSGAIVNQTNNAGQTPLMVAGMRGQTTLSRLLIDAGADPNIVDHKGNTALLLHCSSPWLSPQLVNILTNKETVNRPNNAGCWPLMEVVQSTCQDKHQVLVTLARRGAELSRTSILGYSCLHMACNAKDWCSAQILVREGAHVKMEPLLIALQQEHFHLANLMLAAGASCYIEKEKQAMLSPQARDWMKQQQKMTKTLKDMSRLRVRKMVSKGMERFLEKAEMPRSLKQYVYFLLE